MQSETIRGIEHGKETESNAEPNTDNQKAAYLEAAKMRLLFYIVALQCVEWCAVPFLRPADTWVLLLGCAYIKLFVALLANFYVDAKDIQNRMLLGFCTLTAGIDALVYEAWLFFEITLSSISPVAILFFCWFWWVYFRQYDRKNDTINPKNVMLLLHKPTKWYAILHSFLGLPYGSLCIMADMQVWAFKRSSGKFERRSYFSRLVNGHLLIDTGAQASPEIIQELNLLVGTKRGYGVKCVSTVKNILEMLGPKWAPKSILEMVPGIYAFRIFRNIERRGR